MLTDFSPIGNLPRDIGSDHARFSVFHSHVNIHFSRSVIFCPLLRSLMKIDPQHFFLAHSAIYKEANKSYQRVFTCRQINYRVFINLLRSTRFLKFAAEIKAKEVFLRVNISGFCKSRSNSVIV
jgi:hypothetical protein